MPCTQWHSTASAECPSYRPSYHPLPSALPHCPWPWRRHCHNTHETPPPLHLGKSESVGPKLETRQIQQTQEYCVEMTETHWTNTIHCHYSQDIYILYENGWKLNWHLDYLVYESINEVNIITVCCWVNTKITTLWLISRSNFLALPGCLSECYIHWKAENRPREEDTPFYMYMHLHSWGGYWSAS